jgi:hypothetical protein
VYITDQNHGYADPEIPIGRQWPANAAVSIGAGSWLGAGAIVLPGASIGRNVVVAAGSVVRGRVPDRCVVAGVPAKVIRSYVAGDGWLPPLRPRGTTQPLADANLAETGLSETGSAAGVGADTVNELRTDGPEGGRCNGGHRTRATDRRSYRPV